ncbi:MAG TPA: hypothetical protein PK264_09850 [Hyphomicrobiaceae bacterium]|nr:hypothetical protein [Hyphomicrobiaceae bacterium]
MLRLLILLVAIAAGLVTALSVSNQLGGNAPGPAKTLLTTTATTFPDWRSLAIGLVVGFALAWLRQFPWRLLPFLLSEWTRVWRRRAILACLAAGFVSVLLFY